LWWAIESKCESDRDRVLALFEERAVWDLRMVQAHILHRLMRRYAAPGTQKDLLTCARLLQLAPDAARGKMLRRGFEEAFQGMPAGDLPAELTEKLAKLGGESVAFGLRRNDPEAVAKALAVVADEEADADERLQYVRTLGEVRQPRCVPALLGIVERSADDLLRAAALTSLRLYDDAQVPATILRLYGTFTDELRGTAQELLAGRPAWALQLLQAVDAGKIDRAAVPRDVVRRIAAYRDERIAGLVAKHWGRVEGATTAQMQKKIERLDGVVRGGAGSPYAGRKLFRAACAKCHQLFGQGGQVGPDLTTFPRADIANMLLHVVNPGAEVREGYEALLVTLEDGRVVSGVLADRDSRVMVLRGADGQAVTVRQDQVEEVAPQRGSLMPEGLLDALTDQEVRDLFAYLRSTQPLYD
jgi:putative heme-binding domain-containing protein